MTRLGVVMVHYHSEDLLQDSVRALLASTLPPDHIRIVDNGSVDGLAEIAVLDGRIHVTTAPHNLGFGAACNLALRDMGDVTHVLLLNPDVTVTEGTLGAMVDALEEDSAIGAITCRLLRPSGALDPACRRSEPTLVNAAARYLGLAALFPSSPVLASYNLTYMNPETAHDVGSGTAAFLLIRREALDAVGGFDERFFLYGEDLDLCRRIRAAGWRIRYDPRATAVHVKGSGRVRLPATTRHFYEAIWIYYRKWGRFRRNPLVLGALAVFLAGLFAREAVINGIRIRIERLAGPRAAGGGSVSRAEPAP